MANQKLTCSARLRGYWGANCTRNATMWVIPNLADPDSVTAMCKTHANKVWAPTADMKQPIATFADREATHKWATAMTAEEVARVKAVEAENARLAEIAAWDAETNDYEFTTAFIASEVEDFWLFYVADATGGYVVEKSHLVHRPDKSGPYIIEDAKWLAWGSYDYVIDGLVASQVEHEETSSLHLAAATAYYDAATVAHRENAKLLIAKHRSAKAA